MEWLNVLLKAPPPSVMWLAVGVSFASAILQVILAIAKAFGYRISRSDRKRDVQSRIDETWFETIIIERSLPSILEFVDAERVTLKAPISGNYKDLNSAFAQRAEALKASLNSVSVLSASSHHQLLRTVDQLSDIVTKHCAANDGYAAQFREYVSVVVLENAFDDCQNKCVSIMRQMHQTSLQAR